MSSVGMVTALWPAQDYSSTVTPCGSPQNCSAGELGPQFSLDLWSPSFSWGKEGSSVLAEHGWEVDRHEILKGIQWTFCLKDLWCSGN